MTTTVVRGSPLVGAIIAMCDVRHARLYFYIRGRKTRVEENLSVRIEKQRYEEMRDQA